MKRVQIGLWILAMLLSVSILLPVQTMANSPAPVSVTAEVASQSGNEPQNTPVVREERGSVDLWSFTFWILVVLVIGIWVGIAIGYGIWGRRRTSSMFRYR